MTQQRLDEIAARAEQDEATAWMCFLEMTKRTNTAQAYINRILGHDPNGGQLMFLSRLRDILNGTDDGAEINRTESDHEP